MIFYGNPKSEVVIVGGQPTFYDENQSLPCPPATIELIENMLFTVGLDPENFLFLPAIPALKHELKKPSAAKIQELAQEHIIPFILKHPRKLVFALGNSGICATGISDDNKGINSYRSVRCSSPYLPGIECAATLDPFFVTSDPDENQGDFLVDLRFAKKLYDKDFKEQTDITIVDLKTPEELAQFIQKVSTWKGEVRVRYDSETSGLHKDKDIIVCFGFCLGERDENNALIVYYWQGYSKLRPLYDDDTMWEFEELFIKLFNLDVNFVLANASFDHWMVEANYCEKFAYPKHDVLTQKWVLDKYGSNGLKDNVTRFLGYSNYEKIVSDFVSEIVSRRGKVMYESSPENEDDFFVLRWYGIPKSKWPKAALNPKKGQGYKWPDKSIIDKKAAAWALLDDETLRLYQCYDAAYTCLLDETLYPLIEKDPKLKQSYDFRMWISETMLRCEQRGLLTDVETNIEMSEKLEGLIGEADKLIQQEVEKLLPGTKDFNPGSGNQLRRVLYGESGNIPYIDAESIQTGKGLSKRSIRELVGNFHYYFYEGYDEVKEQLKSKTFDYPRTKKLLEQEFEKYAKIKQYDVIDKPIYYNGLYEVNEKFLTKKGFPATGKTALEFMYEEKPEEFLRYVIMRGKASKIKSTFIDGIREKLWDDNVLHGEYKALGTKTGRLSSKNPNGQNYPEKIRGQHIARPGYTFVGWDLSQAEVRVLAAVSGDEKLKEAIYSEDFHKTTATLIFGVPLHEVTSAMRQVCKTLNFGIIYGMGAEKLAYATNTTIEEAEKFIEMYLDRFSEVKEWMESQIEFVTDSNYVETVFGTRLYLNNVNSSDPGKQGHAKRVAINAPIQGSAGELTFYFARKQMEEFKRLGLEDIHLVSNIHDAITYEVPEALANAVVDVVKWSIETGCDVAPLNTVKFATDIHVWKHFYDKPVLMEALDRQFGTDKQKLPWHIITGIATDEEEQEELDQLNGVAA